MTEVAAANRPRLAPRPCTRTYHAVVENFCTYLPFTVTIPHRLLWTLNTTVHAPQLRPSNAARLFLVSQSIFFVEFQLQDRDLDFAPRRSGVSNFCHALSLNHTHSSYLPQYPHGRGGARAGGLGAMAGGALAIGNGVCCVCRTGRNVLRRVCAVSRVSGSSLACRRPPGRRLLWWLGALSSFLLLMQLLRDPAMAAPAVERLSSWSRRKLGEISRHKSRAKPFSLVRITLHRNYTPGAPA